MKRGSSNLVLMDDLKRTETQPQLNTKIFFESRSLVRDPSLLNKIHLLIPVYSRRQNNSEGLGNNPEGLGNLESTSRRMITVQAYDLEQAVWRAREFGELEASRITGNASRFGAGGNSITLLLTLLRAFK